MDTNKKTLQKKIKEHKLLSVLAVMVVLGIGTTTAIWVIGFTPSSPTGMVISSEAVIDFTSDFSVTGVVTNNESQEVVEYIWFDNLDGERLLNVELDTIIEDDDDTCDGSGDLSVYAEYLGEEVTDEGNITVVSGLSNLSVTTTAKDLSCPGNITTTLSLTS